MTLRPAFLLRLLGLAMTVLSAPAWADRSNTGEFSIRIGQPLTIPAGSATVRLQYGQPVAMNAVQEFDPYCILELETVREAPQTIEPGRFVVTSVQRRIQDFSGMPVMPPIGIGALHEGGNDPSQIYYVTEFRLRSSMDHRVRSLRCESNQVGIPAPGQHHLSLSEMQRATGRYIAFEGKPRGNTR